MSDFVPFDVNALVSWALGVCGFPRVHDVEELGKVAESCSSTGEEFARFAEQARKGLDFLAEYDEFVGQAAASAEQGVSAVLGTLGGEIEEACRDFGASLRSDQVQIEYALYVAVGNIVALLGQYLIARRVKLFGDLRAILPAVVRPAVAALQEFLRASTPLARATGAATFLAGQGVLAGGVDFAAQSVQVAEGSRATYDLRLTAANMAAGAAGAAAMREAAKGFGSAARRGARIHRMVQLGVVGAAGGATGAAAANLVQGRELSAAELAAAGVQGIVGGMAEFPFHPNVKIADAPVQGAFPSEVAEPALAGVPRRESEGTDGRVPAFEPEAARAEKSDVTSSSGGPHFLEGTGEHGPAGARDGFVSQSHVEQSTGLTHFDVHSEGVELPELREIPGDLSVMTRNDHGATFYARVADFPSGEIKGVTVGNDPDLFSSQVRVAYADGRVGELPTVGSAPPDNRGMVPVQADLFPPAETRETLVQQLVDNGFRPLGGDYYLLTQQGRDVIAGVRDGQLASLYQPAVVIQHDRENFGSPRVYHLRSVTLEYIGMAGSKDLERRAGFVIEWDAGGRDEFFYRIATLPNHELRVQKINEWSSELSERRASEILRQDPDLGLRIDLETEQAVKEVGEFLLDKKRPESHDESRRLLEEFLYRETQERQTDLEPSGFLEDAARETDEAAQNSAEPPFSANSVAERDRMAANLMAYQVFPELGVLKRIREPDAFNMEFREIHKVDPGLVLETEQCHGNKVIWYREWASQYPREMLEEFRDQTAKLPNDRDPLIPDINLADYPQPVIRAIINLKEWRDSPAQFFLDRIDNPEQVQRWISALQKHFPESANTFKELDSFATIFGFERVTQGHAD